MQIIMNPSLPAKPKLPPKPFVLQSKDKTSNSEGILKKNPVISQVKPPIAPKPVLLSKGQRTTNPIVLNTAVDISYNDADTIVKKTWASRQGIPCTPIVSNISDKSTLVPGHRSTLHSRDLSEELPSNKSDCLSHSDLHSDINNVHTANTIPSFQFSPQTPNLESQGSDLVNEKSQSNSRKLPSDSETCPNHSSLLSNTSFLYSNRVTSPSTNSSSSEGSTPDSPMANRPSSVTEVTLRNKKLSVHSRGSSWSEGIEVQHSRTNSADSESSEGLNNSVRKRISSFLGSFGKGSKTRDRSESLFYDYDPDESSQTKSSDSGRNSIASLNESTSIMSNNNHLDSKQCLSERNSNRSSMSDESFDIEQITKTEESVQESEADILDRRKKKCFNVVNELMTSERIFVSVLELLCSDFRKAVEEANNIEKIPKMQFNKIINHLPELLFLNSDLLKDIESRVESWDKFPKVADVIVKKGPFLKLYSTYLIDFDPQTKLLIECCEKYPKFGQLVADFEKCDKCEKLTVVQHMLKPVQRIPQYKLLLQRYLECQESDSPDYADTQLALKIIGDVMSYNNSSLDQDQNHMSKLLSIQSQLGDYEIIKPGRYFVKEGELYKLSRKVMQRRFIILLSDCLLYTSYYSSVTGLRMKSRLSLAGMKVSCSPNTGCDTEFDVRTSTRSFTLRAKNKEEFNEWVSALQTAISNYTSRQMTFDKQNKPPMSASEEPLRIGREAPVWIQDKKVTMCQVCTAAFTMTFRRHHCRACGKVVCGPCSDQNAPMQYLSFQAQRVCIHCFDYLIVEFDHPTANMKEVVKSKLKLKTDAEVAQKMQEIGALFKKTGQSSGLKNQKNVSPRLMWKTEVDIEPQMSGWMYHQRKMKWKHLWFVLKERVLYLSKASEDIIARESIPVLGYNVVRLPEGKYEEMGGKTMAVFQLVHQGGNIPPLVFATDTQFADSWIQALEEATHM